jgi:hypothetical protein
MKTIIAGLFLSLLFTWGCETRTFQYLSSVDKVIEFTINQQGAFTESKTIYASEINSELDLPANAEVRNVFIEAFSIKAEILQGNQADEIKFDGFSQAEGDNTQTEFLSDAIVPIDITTQDFIKLAFLVNDGIDVIRDDIEGFVIDGIPAFIIFTITGDTSPNPGQTIHANVSIQISLAVAYDLETEFIRG